MVMKVRIGIDVGGTFTDAVAINNDTFELIGSVKIPTTHTAEEGVAAGIIIALERLMNEYDIKPEDVTFLAHGRPRQPMLCWKAMWPRLVL